MAKPGFETRSYLAHMPMCYGFLLVHKPLGLVSILTEIALVRARALLPHCMLQERKY